MIIAFLSDKDLLQLGWRVDISIFVNKSNNKLGSCWFPGIFVAFLPPIKIERAEGKNNFFSRPI